MIEKIKSVNHLQLMQPICLIMALVMMYFWSNPIATSICFVAAGVYAIAREIQSCSVLGAESESKPERVSEWRLGSTVFTRWSDGKVNASSKSHI